MPAASTFPTAAASWCCGDQESDVALIGPTRDAVRSIVAAGHRLTVLDRSLVTLERVTSDGFAVTAIAAAAEALPFSPYTFDTVICLQNLHEFAPGIALAEIARVLRPGGRLVAVYTTRDDTVPWVRRLATVLQSVDPAAMRGDYGVDAIATLEQSPYFSPPESRSFRTWYPARREQLVDMVARRQAFADVDPEVREAVLEQVGGIYDSMARPPQPLLLPFQATCWSAVVDHEELTGPVALDDGLSIW